MEMTTEAKTARCKRCGSQAVSWVQSKRTQRYYLAWATVGTSRDGAGYGKVRVYPQHPHKCDDPIVGGFKKCEHCGKHHHTPFGLPTPDHCHSYPDAR